MANERAILAEKGQRRFHRFKESIRGSIEHQGASYQCLVDDISERGFHLLSRLAIEVGARMNVYLRLSQNDRVACVVEARHITSEGVGAEIMAIGEASSRLLHRLIEQHYSAHLA